MKLLLLFALLTSTSFSDQKIQEARQLFFRFDEDQHASAILLLSLDKAGVNDSPVLLAYKGVALAASATAESNPISKLNRFLEGKNLVEAAINQWPENPELRLIRLSIQLTAPGFLEYNKQISIDKNHIINNLINNPDRFPNSMFSEKVLIFLQTKAQLTAEEQRLLQN